MNPDLEAKPSRLSALRNSRKLRKSKEKLNTSDEKQKPEQLNTKKKSEKQMYHS